MFSFLQSAVSWWTAQDLHSLIRSLPSVSLDRDSKRVRGKSSLYLGSLCQTLEMCRAPWQPLRTWRRLTIFWWAFRSKAITSPTPTRVSSRTSCPISPFHIWLLIFLAHILDILVSFILDIAKILDWRYYDHIPYSKSRPLTFISFYTLTLRK